MEINKNIEKITKQLLEEIGEDTKREGFIILNGFIPDALKPIISLLDDNFP